MNKNEKPLESSGDSATTNESDTQLERAIRLLANHDSPEDRAKGLAMLISAAEGGDTVAQHNLGNFYYNGWAGFAKDKTEAFRWFSRAAELGDVFAQNQIGVMLLNGEGTEKDPAKAFELVTKAEFSTSDAHYGLGTMYLDGVPGVVEKDVPRALTMFRAVAAGGYPKAQYQLGLMYLEGTNVRKNQRTAIRYFRKAAEQGHEAASDMHEKLTGKRVAPKNVIGGADGPTAIYITTKPGIGSFVAVAVMVAVIVWILIVLTD